MEFYPTNICDVILIKPKVFGDHRGFFLEFWQQAQFAQAGINYSFVQDNHSMSGPNILRGLHYQIKNPQGKLIKVIAGEIFDVAVDLRRNSDKFGIWVGQFLTAENKYMLWIPPGFAHGFYVTGKHAEIIYKCTDFYAPEHERTIRWDDPDLSIKWPLKGNNLPILSEKDAQGEFLKDAEVY